MISRPPVLPGLVNVGVHECQLSLHACAIALPRTSEQQPVGGLPGAGCIAGLYGLLGHHLGWLWHPLWLAEL
jgi:hypothetical protein